MAYRIAFFTPALDQISETFIKNQIDKLNPILIFHKGYFPEKYNRENIVRIRHKILYFYLSHKKIQELLIIRLLKEYKIDVIVMQYSLSLINNFFWLKSCKIPVIIHFHGFDVSCFEYLKMKNFNKYLNLANAAIMVSCDMKKRIEELGVFYEHSIVQPCPPGELNLIPKQKKGTNKSIKIIILGRFTEKKGPILNVFLIYRVIKLLKIKSSLVQFDWVGDGEYFETCRTLSKQLNIDCFIKFYGGIENKEALEILADGNIFVQNSITATDGNREGTPVALLEAARFGLAVVASRHEGIKDIVDNGINGYLIEEGDVENMALKIVELIDDEKLRLSMGELIKTKFENNYNEKIYFAKYFELIQKVVEHGKVQI